MRCPTSRFATSTISHIAFLLLLAVATLRIGETSYPMVLSNDEIVGNITRLAKYSESDRARGRLRETMRPDTPTITYIQYTILLWVVGALPLLLPSPTPSASYVTTDVV